MENRAKILECALALFSARGYEAVGVQEIVEAAGVTKPSLYHYFSSKLGLLDTLLEENFAGFLADLRKAALYERDLPLTLEKIARAYFDFACRQPAFYRMQLAMQFAPPDSQPNQAVARFWGEQYGIIEAVFVQAVTQHGNLRGRQRAYTATFIGMLNTYIGLFLNAQGELNDPLLYKAVHQYMHGIFS